MDVDSSDTIVARLSTSPEAHLPTRIGRRVPSGNATLHWRRLHGRYHTRFVSDAGNAAKLPLYHCKLAALAPPIICPFRFGMQPRVYTPRPRHSLMDSTTGERLPKSGSGLS